VFSDWIYFTISLPHTTGMTHLRLYIASVWKSWSLNYYFISSRVAYPVTYTPYIFKTNNYSRLEDSLLKGFWVFSFFLYCLTLEDGTDNLSRNVGNKLPINVAKYHRRAMTSFTRRGIPRWPLSGKLQDSEIGCKLVLPWLALFRSNLSTGQHNMSLILVLTGTSRWRQQV